MNAILKPLDIKKDKLKYVLLKLISQSSICEYFNMISIGPKEYNWLDSKDFLFLERLPYQR